MPASTAALRVTGSLGPRTGVVVASGGLERTAVLCFPTGLPPGSPLPLVLDLHGSGSTPRDQLSRSRLDQLGAREGFLVAAPRGGLPSRIGHAWNVPYVTSAENGPDDEAFLRDLVTALVAKGWADADRVFASGMSGGARMASQLACDHPELLAGIAAVAGLRAGPPDTRDPYRPDAAAGAPRGRVPVVAFHGTADAVNPYWGNGPSYWGYSVPAALARWAQANRSTRDATEEDVTGSVRVIAYGRSRFEADAVLYVVEGGGHTWPGSPVGGGGVEGVATTEIDATVIMWDFFRRRGGLEPA
jgi:polyhydroxybutyrate depolymerase